MENKELDGSTVSTEEQPIPVGNRTYNSLEELKKAHLELTKKIGEQGQKLGSQNKMIEALQTKATAVTTDQILDNPTEIFTKLRNEIKAELKAELKAEDSDEKAESTFWDEFFTKAPELKPLESKVKSDAYGNMYTKLAELPTMEEKHKAIQAEWSILFPKKEEETTQASDLGTGSSHVVQDAPGSKGLDAKDVKVEQATFNKIFGNQ